MLRLGWIADYFSRPVLIGYIHGVAVVLIIGQLGKLLGLSIDARDPLPQLWEVLTRARRASAAPRSRSPRPRSRLLLGLRFLMPRLPAALARRRRSDRDLVGARSAGARCRGRRHRARGAAELRRAEPRLGATSLALAPAAVGIFLVSFADEILTARSFAGKHNQHVRASQELLAMGAANAAAGLTPGLLGRRERLAHGGQRQHGRAQPDRRPVAAATVLVIVLFLTEPVQYLPKAVLGAVIVSAAIGLIEPQAWRALAAVDPVEVAIAGVTTGCVIVFGVLEALAVAVGLSVIDAVRRSARPHDAVLGWVERLGRYGDVSLHPTRR